MYSGMYNNNMSNMHKRSFLEVDTNSHSVSTNPIENFTHLLRLKHGGSQLTEKQNAKLLDKLIYNNYISKSSIIWNDHSLINRIYGLNINSDGTIRYEHPKSQSPEKNKPLAVQMPRSPELDFAAIQNSIRLSHKI